jgi:tRNA pseudouridine55 synthase
MATGVLVIGVGKATRLLGHLALTEKEYEATIRLGQATDTGDAEGSIISAVPAGGVDLAAVRAAAAALTGEIMQVPPAVSAIKVGGRRSYQLARAGTPPALAPRPVTVRALRILAARRAGELLDVDVTVTCSSGTYIRALARDMGQALGVGGHLTALRRTRAGPYALNMAVGLGGLTAMPPLLALEQAAAGAFPSLRLTPSQARAVAHGQRLAAAGLPPAEQPSGGAPGGPLAAFAPDGTLIALVQAEGADVRPVAVFAPRACGRAARHPWQA